MIHFTPLASALIRMGVLAAPTAAQSGQYAAISAADSVEFVEGHWPGVRELSELPASWCRWVGGEKGALGFPSGTPKTRVASWELSEWEGHAEHVDARRDRTCVLPDLGFWA